MSQERAKESAAHKAADLIEDGQIVGLGSGTTANHFIDALSARAKKGLKIQAVASSHHSAERARQGGLEIVDINSVPRVDITVDGADEIDPKKQMIKGRGGAHVREKILAYSSTEMVVIADETKLVQKLGAGPLPVEVLFYGSPAIRQKIEETVAFGKWRMHEDGTLFISENGNLLLDLSFPFPPEEMRDVHHKLIEIPGVVDTGFFYNIAKRIFIGGEDGTVRLL